MKMNKCYNAKIILIFEGTYITMFMSVSMSVRQRTPPIFLSGELAKKINMRHFLRNTSVLLDI